MIKSPNDSNHIFLVDLCVIALTRPAYPSIVSDCNRQFRLRGINVTKDGNGKLAHSNCLLGDNRLTVDRYTRPLPAILVPRHTLSDENNLFPHSLEDLSTSVPENTSFPHNTNTLG
ncbi:hypothetical protein NQ317_007994 [Molorchus minor]|uniref:Uncharacterized protein n=1 Tax=Molorchus minor TaxID=1323400 RepID=A0ABQ9JJW9_9CUCU|nr:hypothetical protein NQ317_007994 [Molorchus minor]